MDCCFVKPKDVGKRLQWDITELCNLNCLHCCAGKSKNISCYSDEIIMRTIQIIKSEGFEKVSLSGGEPTLNKSFAKIAKMLFENNISVGLISNLFYDLSIIKDALQYIDSVTTSIDGSEEVHNRIRGKNCYKKTMQNIKTLLDNGKSVKVIYTLQDSNINCLEETISCLSKIGIKIIMLAHISPQGRGKTNSKLLRFSMSNSDLMHFIADLRKKYNLEIQISKCSYLLENKTENCLAGKDVFYLSPDLILHPCHLNAEYGISIFKEEAVESVSKHIKDRKRHSV